LDEEPHQVERIMVMENERSIEQQKLDVPGHRANDPLYLPADTILRMQIGIPYGLAALAVDYATHWNGSVFLTTSIAGCALVGAAPEILGWERENHTIRKIINTLAHLRRSPLSLYSAALEHERRRTLAPVTDRIVDAEVRTLSSESTVSRIVPTISEQKQSGPRRLTIDEIVAMCEYNSFKIIIGGSLTDPDATPVQVSIFKQHFKFIGASQKGKSSMAAAFLDIITRTHDTSRVLIALLDFEDMTSKLFADLPHLAEVEVNGKHIPLHATTREQVLEHLGYIVELVNIRYQMSKLEIKNEPLLIVYLEEFLALKDYFKSQVKSASGDEERAQAEKNYTDLVFRIKEIARLGLKARVQLVMCAQVDYADEDFREALANVTNGMSFCVKPTAAQAAGFMNAELLAKNAQSKKVGQAVAETVSCNDLVLAPDYDLEARIAEFEERELEEERRNPNARSSVKSTFLTPVGGHRNRGQQVTTPVPAPIEQVQTSELQTRRAELFTLHRSGKLKLDELVELLHALPDVEEQPATVRYPAYQTTANGTVMEDLPMRSLASPWTAQDREIDCSVSLERAEEPGENNRSDLAANAPESTVPMGGKSSPSAGTSGTVWGPEDYQFSPDQAQEFLRLYRKKPQAVKEVLRLMDGGKGVSNRYGKYAYWLLKTTGEVK
jgi:hypothetical protein